MWRVAGFDCRASLACRNCQILSSCNYLTIVLVKEETKPEHCHLFTPLVSKPLANLL